MRVILLAFAYVAMSLIAVSFTFGTIAPALDMSRDALDKIAAVLYTSR